MLKVLEPYALAHAQHRLSKDIASERVHIFVILIVPIILERCVLLELLYVSAVGEEEIVEHECCMCHSLWGEWEQRCS
jgi:hypothetical protein